MRNGTRNGSSEALLRARRLRNEPSTSEKVFWECIRKKRLGYRFNRQVPIGPYVLDFYCAEASLAVEIGGEQHAERKAQDETRDEWLRSRGIDTIRIPSLDLFDETGLIGPRWLRLIEKRCAERSSY